MRSLIEVALEDAWHELLKKDGALQATLTRNKLRSTMVALASVGETDHRKLKWFAIHACEAHYKRSNRRQQHAQERTEWRLALSGAD